MTPYGDEQEAGHDDDDGDETALAGVAPSSSFFFLMLFLEGGVGEVHIAVPFPPALLLLLLGHGILQSVKSGNWVLFLSEAEKLGQICIVIRYGVKLRNLSHDFVL